MYDINKGNQLIHGYCFNVEFMIKEKFVEIGFSSVSTIENSAEYETIVEGNGHIHIVPKHISQPKTVTFSKGILSSGAFIIDDLYVGRNIEEIVVSVGNENYYNEGLRGYTLKNCIITKCSISGLDAMKSGVLLENFEVVYTEKLEIWNYSGNYSDGKDMQMLFNE